MTLKARHREPYNARHSFVSWSLVLGKNLLWVAGQHGHGVQMLSDFEKTDAGAPIGCELVDAVLTLSRF